MKRSMIVLAIIALSVLSLMPKSALARERAATAVSANETVTLTASKPVDFPTKAYKFDNGETAKIGAKYEVGLNENAEPQIVLNTRMEFPGGNTFEKTIPVGGYTGPTEINMTPVELPSEQLNVATITVPSSNEEANASSVDCGSYAHTGEACVWCTTGPGGVACRVCAGIGVIPWFGITCNNIARDTFSF